MAIIDECLALDRASIGDAGPFCPLVSSTLVGGILDLAFIGDAGPYHAEGGSMAPPVGSGGGLVRLFPAMVRVYPGIGRIYPL